MFGARCRSSFCAGLASGFSDLVKCLVEMERGGGMYFLVLDGLSMYLVVSGRRGHGILEGEVLAMM
jgi:hypothetical protein